MEELLAAPVDGFGESTMAELKELRKALDIGYTQPVTGTGPNALRVESLESTLKLLTYKAENIKLWARIPKKGATSTVEEYNRLNGYGDESGGFVVSGELPETEDSIYERADQKVKFLGTTRVVNHVATVVNTMPPDVIGQETQNGALWLMGKANTALYSANADAIPEEFNGCQKQIIDGGGTVVDMRGQPISQPELENCAQVIADNYGVPGQMFGNGKIFSDFSKIFYSNQRHLTPPAKEGVAGTPMTGFMTINGTIEFNADPFVKRGDVAPAAATSTKAPTAPAITPASPGAAAGSKFVTADAGVYKYQVTAVNRFGESLPTALSAGSTVAAGDGVGISIADGGGTYPATAYKIYRTAKGGSVAYYVGVIVPRAKSGGAYASPTVWTDLNEWLPQCFSAIVFTMDAEAFCFKQLLPMIKMDLAIISPAIRWMQLLYGTPIVYAPKKHVVFKNVGVAA